MSTQRKATANRGVRVESRSRPTTASGGATASVESVATPVDDAAIQSEATGPDG